MLHRGALTPAIGALLLLLSGCSTIHSLLPWSDQDADTQQHSIQTVTHNAPPQIVWQRNLDYLPLGGTPGFSQPALIKLANGQPAIAAGGSDHFVHIFSLTSGNEMRRIAVDESIESGALQLTNGIVVVGDITGNLYGIDPNQATIVWRLHLSTLLLGRPVTIANDFLLQTMDNRLYRISSQGKKVWSFDGYPGGISMHAATSPLVDHSNNRIIAALTTGDVIALNADNGDLIWRKQLLLNANAAVLSEMKSAVADPLRIADLHYGIDHVAPALIVPLYQGDVHILDANNGEQRATRSLSLRAAPLSFEHTLILADSNGTVRAINTESGDTQWKTDISKHELTEVTLWQHQLWISDNTGQLFRITTTGKLLGNIALPGSINRTPIPTPAGIIVRSSRGGIYLIH